MAEHDTGELFLAGSLDDDDSDGDSDYESNGSARSGYSDGGSIFGELSACREHHHTNQRRFTARHGDELDDSAYRRVGAAGGPSAISTIVSAKISLGVPCESGVLRLHQIAPAEKQPLPTQQRGGGSDCSETSINNGAAPPYKQESNAESGRFRQIPQTPAR